MTELDAIKAMSDDHKIVRDTLLEMVDTIKKKDVTKAFELLINLDKIGGPHFRAEEETMYPELKKFFGDQYYEKLLTEHDSVINAAKKVAETLGKGSLTDKDVQQLIKIIQNEIMPHPITCSGLEILMERLSPAELKTISKSLVSARKADVPLLEWADSIRARKA
ncbi:MAG: hemerythrin domain-containing protein [Thaumarchaeota archaeon]|nr:hemerythrin domain-containing protein [Nitrososphaerota archaeon]MCL5318399.1 hemerythrin domain-containing protein [Nitrososphaerota archaeon]